MSVLEWPQVKTSRTLSSILLWTALLISWSGYSNGVTSPPLRLVFPCLFLSPSCFLSYPSCFLSYPGLATRIASPRTHCSWSFFPPSLIPFLFLFLSNSKRGVSSSLVPLPTAFCLSQHACANRRRKAREWGRERARARARPPARPLLY